MPELWPAAWTYPAGFPRWAMEASRDRPLVQLLRQAGVASRPDRASANASDEGGSSSSLFKPRSHGQPLAQSSGAVPEPPFFV